MDNWKWFVNEDGEVYTYDPDKQCDDFPNDYHTPYDTLLEAMTAPLYRTHMQSVMMESQ